MSEVAPSVIPTEQLYAMYFPVALQSNVRVEVLDYPAAPVMSLRLDGRKDDIIFYLEKLRETIDVSIRKARECNG